MELALAVSIFVFCVGAITCIVAALLKILFSLRDLS
jgi:hypothetical protein